MSTVDQQKLRRTRTGLIAHDPARAQPGYTLFAPMFGDGTVCLVDMDGKVAHTWRLRYRPGPRSCLFRFPLIDMLERNDQIVPRPGRREAL